MSFHTNTRQATFLCLLAAILASVNAKKLGYENLFSMPFTTDQMSLRVSGFKNNYHSKDQGFEWSKANGHYSYNNTEMTWMHTNKRFQMSQTVSGGLAIQRSYASSGMFPGVPSELEDVYRSKIPQLQRDLLTKEKKALFKQLRHTVCVSRGRTVDFKNDNIAFWTSANAYDPIDGNTVSTINISNLSANNMDSEDPNLHNDLVEAMKASDFELLFEEGPSEPAYLEKYALLLERLKACKIQTHRLDRNSCDEKIRDNGEENSTTNRCLLVFILVIGTAGVICICLALYRGLYATPKNVERVNRPRNSVRDIEDPTPENDDQEQDCPQERESEFSDCSEAEA